eukprot:scaffold99852_cov75-Phaeocystis_antarctica.AAC.3
MRWVNLRLGGRQALRPEGCCVGCMLYSVVELYRAKRHLRLGAIAVADGWDGLQLALLQVALQPRHARRRLRQAPAARPSGQRAARHRRWVGAAAPSLTVHPPEFVLSAFDAGQHVARILQPKSSWLSLLPAAGVGQVLNRRTSSRSG